MTIQTEKDELARARAEIEALSVRLAEAEHTIALTENLVGVGFWRFVPETRERFWSPSIFQIFGLDPANGAPAAGGIDMFDPEHRATLRDQVAGIGAGRDLDTEYGITRGDGRRAFIRMTGSMKRKPDGSVDYLYGSIIDITEAKLREAALQARTEEARAATVAKSEFLANMSHEIRTPLTAVIGYAEMLAKIPDLPDKARTYAERVSRSGETLNAIVDRILDFSKIEAGRITLKPEPVKISALIEDALAQIRAAAEGKGLNLAVETTAPLPEALMVDRIRLMQVMTNLLVNAVRYTDAGDVHLRISHDLNTQQLHVSVTDTGVGVAPDKLEHLFQRFAQIEMGNARRFGGVGLGLAIARGLVELMEGGITAASEIGEGSTFSFWVSAPALASLVAAPLAPSQPVNLARVHILVADDVAANREIVSALLEPYAPRIVEAESGAQAVEMAARESFDLILMDIQMPGMDGLEATRTIREAPGPNRGTPVVAISASVLPGDVRACLDAGMNDHVAKPISPADLISKVAHWAVPAGRTQALTEGPA